MGKKTSGYVYDVYDESYYRYKVEKDKLRSTYPKYMARKDWKAYFADLMDLIHSSEDWQQWVWDNPLPYEGVYRESKIRNRNDARKVRRYRKQNYPTFVLFIDDKQTDREWNDLKTAEGELGLSKGTISAILNGHRRKMDNGYFFKFKEDLEEKA